VWMQPLDFPLLNFLVLVERLQLASTSQYLTAVRVVKAAGAGEVVWACTLRLMHAHPSGDRQTEASRPLQPASTQRAML